MTLRETIDRTTVADLRSRGSFKWTAPGPEGYGAAVAEMDFGAAPPVLDALQDLRDRALFGYLPGYLADGLAAECAGFLGDRFGWAVDPADVRHVNDVLSALEVAITRFSRPGSPVILPTPAYMPFLAVPPYLGREVLQVPMHEDAGRFTLDLDGLDGAFRAGGDLLVLCNPYNPLGRVFTVEELQSVTGIVDRHGGRVFADEIHAPLVYPGHRHVPYASTSATAAGHAITAVSASKAWNLPGLKCAQVVLSNDADRATWAALEPFPGNAASIAGVVASIAAFRDGRGWLDEALAYLDESRHLLTDLLARHAPGVRYRPPEGTYLAWLDCRGLDLAGPPGALVTERSGVLVVDGTACGTGGAGSFRFNFATPHAVLAEMVERIGVALAG